MRRRGWGCRHRDTTPQSRAPSATHGVPEQDRVGSGDQRPVPWNRHLAPRHPILSGPAGDLGIELAYLHLQMDGVSTSTSGAAIASAG